MIINTPYYRQGAGAVIYKTNGQVLTLKRTGEDIWQFQQGGIDESEEPEQTLWRELKEETNLLKNDFIKSRAFPTCTTYTYPEGMILPPHYANCLGQTHYWWFLEIAPEIVIDLSQASDQEFEDCKWITFAEYMQMTHSFKQLVYEELYEYFKTHIYQNQT